MSKRGYGSESTREWTSRGVKAAVDVESVIYNSTRCPAEGGMPSWRLRRDDNHQHVYAVVAELEYAQH